MSGAGQFAGRTALVTGASAGIGRAIALRLAAEGARVIVTARSDAGRLLAAELGGDALFLPCDLADPAAITTLFDSIAARVGGIDLAVNNAGTEQEAEPIDETDPAAFDRLMAVNGRAVWLAMRQEIALMRRRGGGAIVNVASIAGLRGYPGLSLYCAAKHAVIGMSKAAALDAAADNIRINCICPGTTMTAMMTRQMETREGGLDGTIARIPLGRVSAPDEQAAAVLWLLSDQASFVTGEALVVDGGRTIA